MPLKVKAVGYPPSYSDDPVQLNQAQQDLTKTIKNEKKKRETKKKLSEEKKLNGEIFFSSKNR